MPEARIIDGKKHAADLRAEVKAQAALFTERSGTKPCIVFLLVGENPASQVYVRNKGIASEEAGFSHETLRFAPDVSESEILDTVVKSYRGNCTS
jgi:methylenetetrahydrofolate dehydrogenase (NADP+) / methenyltetrahydrofolate cyclohydrolase